MHLTFAQSVFFTATAGAAWLMVRAGTAKGALKVKVRKALSRVRTKTRPERLSLYPRPMKREIR